MSWHSWFNVSGGAAALRSPVSAIARKSDSQSWTWIFFSVVPVALTAAGREAFDGHVAALQAVIQNAQSPVS